MINITDTVSLKQALLSIDETGSFVKSIESFMLEGVLSKDLYYRCVVDDETYVIFEVFKDVIIKEHFYSNTVTGSHRENDKPAILGYSPYGNVISKEWFIKGNPARNHYLKPIHIEYNYNKKIINKIKNAKDERDKGGYVIFNYIKKNKGVSCSYILYNLETNKVVDIFIYSGNERIDNTNIMAACPSIRELTFNECENLSSSNIITVLDMIYQ